MSPLTFALRRAAARGPSPALRALPGRCLPRAVPEPSEDGLRRRLTAYRLRRLRESARMQTTTAAPLR